MKGFKNFLWLLLTLVLIAILAAMPKIVAALQDTAAGNSARYSDMQSVSLTLSGESPESLSLLAKLALLNEGYFYGIAEDSAVMTQEDVIEAVKAGLNPYYYMDLVPYNWAEYAVSAEPYFVYSSSNSEVYCICWVVSISWNGTALYGSSLSLYVDDDTGKILYIHYHSADPLEMYDTSTYVDMVTSAYFQSLGMNGILDDPNAFGVDSILPKNLQKAATDDPGMLYTLSGPDFGELHICIQSYSHGFYVTLD